MRTPVGGPTAVAAGSACWCLKRDGPSVSVRRNVGPPSSRCAAPTAGFTRTTARFTVQPASRDDASTWSTAKTASSKVPTPCSTKVFSCWFSRNSRSKGKIWPHIQGHDCNLNLNYGLGLKEQTFLLSFHIRMISADSVLSTVVLLVDKWGLAGVWKYLNAI